MLRISNFSFRYFNSNEDIINNFSYNFETGVTTLVAKNGSGKSTLVQEIIRYVSNNNVTKNDNEFINADENLKIIYIAQNPDWTLLPWFSVYKNFQIMAECKPFINIVDCIWFMTNIKSFGIDLNLRVSSLSGGQKQLVNIIKALACMPNMLILDEPFSALDIATSSAVKKMFMDWQSINQACVILISHSIEDILDISDTILLLNSKPLKIHRIVPNQPAIKHLNEFSEITTKQVKITILDFLKCNF